MSGAADDPLALAERIATHARPGQRPLIALDNDGTLAPIAPRPESARLVPGARDAIAALAGVADVAILSGRGLDDLVERFAGLDVTLVSEHGLRHRGSDGRTRQLVAGLADATLDALRRDLTEVLTGADGGWLVEDKGVTIAVHHRLVPDDRLEPTLTRVRDLLERAASDGSGSVQVGKSVLELRPRGADKGAALRTLSDERPGAFVLMVGDDVTDEAALAVAEERAGMGVLVADLPRPSAASARVMDPVAVVELLAGLAARLRPAR